MGATVPGTNRRAAAVLAYMGKAPAGRVEQVYRMVVMVALGGKKVPGVVLTPQAAAVFLAVVAAECRVILGHLAQELAQAAQSALSGPELHAYSPLLT